jgi:hypothetical protein
LSGGIVALAVVSGVSTAATLLMTLTTALHFAWPDAWLRGLGLCFAVATVLALARNLFPNRLGFALGVIFAAVPSAVIAAQHAVDHWDDFMTWLPNALYIWKFGTFPTAAAPAVASVWPGYPPGSSLLLASIWSLAGRVVENAGPLLNVACLLILPGLLLRILGRDPQTLFGNIVLGASLGLGATILNVGLDWHWVLSSLPDNATQVALAAAFLLGAEALLRERHTSASHLAALAFILAFVTNLKQTGLILVVLLISALAIVRWTAIDSADRPEFRRPALLLSVVCLPSAAVWLCWLIYRTGIFPASAFSFHALEDWHFSALPDLLLAILRLAAQYWLYFVPVFVVVIRGCYVLGNRWLGRNPTPLSFADSLAAVFALIEVGYTGFLLISYLGAFADDEARRAAEWFRYQAQLGGAGLLTAIALIVERAPRPLPVAVPAVGLALLFATVCLVLPAPGVYPGRGVYSRTEIEQLREIGRDVGEAVAQAGTPVKLEFVNIDELLGVLIVRYDIWARSPILVRDVSWTWAANQDELVDLSAAAILQGSTVVALENYGGIHCALSFQGSRIRLLGPTRDAAPCLALLSRTKKQPY